eukprot:TRINITY_DN7496_c0_g1_i1.p2 TRINITY_DN7496_c0_g1~~TRINITY_DN7496_c0_g1_i1.p2  ORF type:complete len:159 (+),score=23.04 TRINITY_DN7496_c0_g1_i1:53-478(+)
MSVEVLPVCVWEQHVLPCLPLDSVASLARCSASLRSTSTGPRAWHLRLRGGVRMPPIVCEGEGGAEQVFKRWAALRLAKQFVDGGVELGGLAERCRRSSRCPALADKLLEDLLARAFNPPCNPFTAPPPPDGEGDGDVAVD